MTTRRILVVDDDPVTRRLVNLALGPEGHDVTEVGDAETAVTLLADARPDLLVLDVNLPGMSGFELLSRLPPAFDVPVIVLTGREEESDRVLGLDLGAVDYVVKPFLPREFAARVRAVLRRQPGADTRSFDFGDLVIGVEEREVTLRDQAVDLTPREFDVLVYLAGRPRRVVSRRELLEEVWRSKEEWQDPATVTEHVRRLRRKLEDDPARPRWLQTVRGVGYRFEP
ncbi:MAG: response regulator transcription factor [Acidimicrobiales bacterium]